MADIYEVVRNAVDFYIREPINKVGLISPSGVSVVDVSGTIVTVTLDTTNMEGTLLEKDYTYHFRYDMDAYITDLEVTSDETGKADTFNSKIVIKAGQVQSVEEWVLWNGTPANTISIERTVNGFSSTISDPEHGGRFSEGKTLVEVLGGLHESVQAEYVKLFNMLNATVEKVQRVFPRYSVETS